MGTSRNWRIGLFASAFSITAACSSFDHPSGPSSKPEFAISDAVHEGGTSGFYFLPPMVAQPTFSGTFDADITALNPAIEICDVTNGLDSNCGGAGGTPAVVVFTTTGMPAITVDLATPQYQVNWDTKGAGFVAGHTYRLHVATTTACGARRELGFADVLLSTTPGQVKFLQTSDIIVLQDGRTLPIHFRIETGAVGNCWTTAASMPEAKAEPGVGVVNGRLYVVGGSPNPGTIVATVYAYDPTTNTWATKTSMPTARAGLAVGVVNGILYAVGGQNGSTDVATLEAYDPATDSWATKTSAPTARSLLGVGVVNGILYAVGGQNSSGFPATVEAYDPATNTWATKASMPNARASLAVGVVNGILYAVGGGTNVVPPSTTVQAYDPVTDTWATKMSIPTARQGSAVGVVNGILYAVGGDPNCSPGGAAESYDPSTNTWTTIAPMPTGRGVLGAGVVNGILYAVGGQSACSVSLGTNEAYHP